MASLSERSATERQQQRRQEVLWQQLQARSRRQIYGMAMRAGGEAFGRPFALGVASLTERAVKRFKQRGFFSFVTVERVGRAVQPNKFSRHGAAPYRGRYGTAGAEAGRGTLVGRLLAALRRRLGRRRAGGGDAL